MALAMRRGAVAALRSTLAGGALSRACAIRGPSEGFVPCERARAASLVPASVRSWSSGSGDGKKAGDEPAPLADPLGEALAAAGVPPAGASEDDASAKAAAERQQGIRELLASPEGARLLAGAGGPDAAQAFIASFFAQQDGEDGGEDEDEDAGPGADADDASPSSLLAGLTPSAGLSAEERAELEAGFKGLKRGSRRVLLQQLLAGRILDSDPRARAEWEAISRSFSPPSDLRMKVVDVARTCKVTGSGKLYRYSTLVVVGNGAGVLGWGQGKAAEMQPAVRKAYARACSNLFPVPRFGGHTVPHAVKAKHGQVRIELYPKAAGQGIVANDVAASICKMAGIHDVGVKVHGSRSRRNLVHCLFAAFDAMRTHEEVLQGAEPGQAILAAPPGRFGNRLK